MRPVRHVASRVDTAPVVDGHITPDQQPNSPPHMRMMAASNPQMIRRDSSPHICINSTVVARPVATLSVPSRGSESPRMPLSVEAAEQHARHRTPVPVSPSPQSVASLLQAPVSATAAGPPRGGQSFNYNHPDYDQPRQFGPAAGLLQGPFSVPSLSAAPRHATHTRPASVGSISGTPSPVSPSLSSSQSKTPAGGLTFNSLLHTGGSLSPNITPSPSPGSSASMPLDLSASSSQSPPALLSPPVGVATHSAPIGASRRLILSPSPSTPVMDGSHSSAGCLPLRDEVARLAMEEWPSPAPAMKRRKVDVSPDLIVSLPLNMVVKLVRDHGHSSSGLEFALSVASATYQSTQRPSDCDLSQRLSSSLGRQHVQGVGVGNAVHGHVSTRTDCSSGSDDEELSQLGTNGKRKRKGHAKSKALKRLLDMDKEGLSMCCMHALQSLFPHKVIGSPDFDQHVLKANAENNRNLVHSFLRMARSPVAPDPSLDPALQEAAVTDTAEDMLRGFLKNRRRDVAAMLQKRQQLGNPLAEMEAARELHERWRTKLALWHQKRRGVPCTINPPPAMLPAPPAGGPPPQQ